MNRIGDSRSKLEYYAPPDAQVPVWVILFDDPDRDPRVFIGSGAEQAAKKHWEFVSQKWNCHLLTSVPVDTE